MVGIFRDFKAGNTASFMRWLQSFFAILPYHKGPEAAIKAESVFRNAVSSIFLQTGQLGYTGKYISQGRIDRVVKTPEHVYIFKFKVDKPVEEALGQMECNGYAKPSCPPCSS